MSDETFNAAAWEQAIGRLSPLARELCPTREVLAQAPLPAEFRRHVEACPGCRDDVRDLNALLASEPAPLGLVARLKLWIDGAKGLLEELDTGGLLPASVPVPVAVRGSQRSAQAGARTIPFGGGSLSLSYMPTAAGLDLKLRAEGGAPTEFRALVGPVGHPAWEGRTAIEGSLEIAGLAPGTYAVQVMAPGSREPDLDLTLDLVSGAQE